MGISKVKVLALIGLMISGMAQGHPLEREVHERIVRGESRCSQRFCRWLKKKALEEATFHCHKINHGEVTISINRCDSYYSGRRCRAIIEFFCE